MYCIDLSFVTLHLTWINTASIWSRPDPIERDLGTLLSVCMYLTELHYIDIYISATSILDATCFCANYWQGRRAYSQLTFTYYHICDIFQLLFLLCPFASTVEQDL